MSAREFEQQVRRRMDELTITPSGKVWANVQQQIRNKRRRRAVYTWMPVLGIFLCVTGYLLLSHTHTPNTPNGPTTTGVSPVPDKATELPKPSVKPLVHTLQMANVDTHTKNLTGRTIANETISQHNRLASDEAEEIGDDDVRMLPSYQTPGLSDFAFRSDLAFSLPPASDNAVAKSLVTFNNNHKVSANRYIQQQAAGKGKRSHNHRWQWGFQGSAGIANISEGNLFDLFGSPASKASSGSYAAYPGSFYGNPSPQPVHFSKTGWSAGAGFFVQRVVSRRIAVSAGIMYRYHDTRVSVGSRVDSTTFVSNPANAALQINNYYRGGQVNNYTNRFHFIELPVTAQYTFNPASKIPVKASTGITIARLVHTDALYYDGTSSVFYQDNALYRKTQFGATVGFSVTLFGSGGHPLEFGPVVQSNVSNLFKSKSAGNQHLVSAGLQARLFLRK